MLIGLLAALLGAIIGGAIVTLRRRRKADGGGSDTIPCVLRVDGRWRQGKLTLTAEAAQWRPRFGRTGETNIELATTTVMDYRAVTPKEAIAMSPGLTVLALNAHGKRVELAVLPGDVPLLDKAFGV